MTKEQFINVIGDIDDKFLSELAADYPPNNSDNLYDVFIEDMEKPQTIRLNNRRVPFWKIAASAAAVICVITAGLFAILRQQPPSVPSPGDSRSGVSISNPKSDPTSELSSAIPENSDSEKSSEDRPEYGSFTAWFRNDMTGSSGNKITFRSETVVKSNSLDFAQIGIEYRGATERFPIYVQIFKKADRREWSVSDNVKFTDGKEGKLKINYTEAVEPGDELVLLITASEGAYAKGSWVP